MRRYSAAMAREPMSTDAVLNLHSQLSNWGRWGADDERGSLNFITQEVSAAAAHSVQTGKTVSCARPLNTDPALDNPHPVAHHMTGTATEGHGADYFAISHHGFGATHIDALCHIFHEDQLHNGYSSATVTAHGATKLGIEKLRSGVVTRGALLDVAAVRGVEALEPGTPIFPEDLEAAEAAAGIKVQQGDALLIRTGRWRWRELHGPWSATDLIAGLDASCLAWLHQREVALLGSDGVSDVIPSRVENVRAPIHTVAIVALGVYLVDNLDLDELASMCADERRWTFQFVVAPLVLNRGTGSPVNPIAVF
jgi:kynurenine formamidase